LLFSELRTELWDPNGGGNREGDGIWRRNLILRFPGEKKEFW